MARLFGDREDVRLGNALRIDALLALDRGKRRDAVAQPRGFFKRQRLGRFLHFPGQTVADGAAASRQEIARLADEAGVIADRDFAGAGRRASLDLMQQAGARAILVIAVGTGAQQECALQRVERAVHGAGAGEGPK